MPITTLSPRSRRRGSYAWYPIACAVWALVAVVAVALMPLDTGIPPLVFCVVVAPGAFFATVQITATIADASARRGREQIR